MPFLREIQVRCGERTWIDTNDIAKQQLYFFMHQWSEFILNHLYKDEITNSTQQFTDIIDRNLPIIMYELVSKYERLVPEFAIASVTGALILLLTTLHSDIILSSHTISNWSYCVLRIPEIDNEVKFIIQLVVADKIHLLS